MNRARVWHMSFVESNPPVEVCVKCDKEMKYIRNETPKNGDFQRVYVCKTEWCAYYNLLLGHKI